jgi:putative transposase
MEFLTNNIYHIYNRGNNKDSIFFKDGNYIYFIQKIRKYISPHCNILAYVLMRNHFHLLVHTDERIEKQLAKENFTKNVLSEGIRLLLSSYTKGINKQENRTGNLIQQNTKFKCVYDNSVSESYKYAVTCFDYIHSNPLKHGFVDNMEDWHYSSYRDYAGLRNGTLCNKELACKILGIEIEDVKQNKILDEESLKNIW